MTGDRDVIREGLLVLRAQSGDRAALDDLFRLVGPALARHLRHVISDASLAEDALQEAFLLAHRKLRWLRDPRLFRPWLYRIATREAVRLANRQRRRLEEPLNSDIWEPAEIQTSRGPEERLMGSRAASAISAVSPASRAVMSLHYLEGYTLQEAAALLDLPAGTIKSRLSAGLAQLRRLFGLTVRD